MLELARAILAGEAQADLEHLRRILQAEGPDRSEILAGAHLLRHARSGNLLRVNRLCNAQSGRCGEDCSYCSQSTQSDSGVEEFPFLSAKEIINKGKAARVEGASCFCIVASQRNPSPHDIQVVAQAAESILEEGPMDLCASLGLLKKEEAQTLAKAGVRRYNHNLNTHPNRYSNITTTHTFEDRLATLRNCRESGLNLCSGFIAGLGETLEERAELLQILAELNPEVVPINFYLRLPGSRVPSDISPLQPWECVLLLCATRFALPKAEIRVGAGREEHIRTLQPLALLAAESFFTQGYLTTPGQGLSSDQSLCKDGNWEWVRGE